MNDSVVTPIDTHNGYNQKTGTWQRCKAPTSKCEIGPRMIRGQEAAPCRNCLKSMEIVEVYLCMDEDCPRGSRRKKEIREKLPIDLICPECKEVLIQHTTFSIIPA